MSHETGFDRTGFAHPSGDQTAKPDDCTPAAASPMGREALERAVLKRKIQRRREARRSDEGMPPGVTAERAAEHGISGGAEPLPHLAEIQRSFGPHDVSHVKAHSGAVARQGAEALGAEAYATGEHVAFARTPDLHTAAHEAAHVIQQRRGIHLKDGAGESGDVHEQHADAVADRVVRGESAEALLEEYAGATPLNARAPAPNGKIQRKQNDSWEEAKRRAIQIKAALLDGWTEDEEGALDQLRGQSTLMLREIRAQYAAVTGGRSLEADIKKYCNGTQYNEALGLLWAHMSLADRLRSNIDKGWLWDSENEAGILDVLRTASRAELDAAATNKEVMALLRRSLDDDEYYRARKLLTPNQMYDAVVERLKKARGLVDDDESAAYNVLLDLGSSDRKRLWNERQDLFSFMSAKEKASARRICLGTEADALDERMKVATDGLGTDDDAVALVVSKTADAARREELIDGMLKSGLKPDGQRLTAAERQQLVKQQAALGGVRRRLLTTTRTAGGELRGDSFLGRLHGDVGTDEYQALAGKAGGDSFELAKQQILDAIGLFSDDEDKIYQVFQRITDPAVRKRLWEDPQIHAALQGNLSREERSTAALASSGDSYVIALQRLKEALHGMDTDEEGIFRILTEMSPKDRARLQKERPPIYVELTTSRWLSPQEHRMARAAIETGRVPTGEALDWTFGGDWDGTEEEMLAQTFGQLTDEERATYRLGYWIHREGRKPADGVQEAALRRFRALEARMERELGADDLQTAMDQLIGTPSPEELKTEAGRMVAAGILRGRMKDKQALGSGLASALTSTDETKDQAGAQLESQYRASIEDGRISMDELAVLASLDANFAARYQEHVDTVDKVRSIASTVAAVGAGILVTALTGGAAGPAVAGLLGEYGAAALAGTVAAVAKVGTSELMAGDHFDALSSEGGMEALTGFADGATAVLSASIAARFSKMIGLGHRALAAEMTRSIVDGTGSAMRHAGRRFVADSLEGAISGFFAGAVGDVVLTAADSQTWRRSVWDVITRFGTAILQGGGTGAVTGAVLSGTIGAARGQRDAQRTSALVEKLRASGIPDAELRRIPPEVFESITAGRVLPSGVTLDPAEPSKWADQIRQQLARSIGVDAAGMTVTPLGGGRSGASVYRVKHGDKDLGVFKLFDTAEDALREAHYLRVLDHASGDGLQPVEAKALAHVDMGGNARAGLLMAHAPGMDVPAMARALPQGGAARVAGLDEMEQSIRQVGKAMARTHIDLRSGVNCSVEHLEGEASYILKKVDGLTRATTPLSDRQVNAIKAALETDVLPPFKEAALPATIAHGDANAGNFIVDRATGKVSVIDVGTMRWGVDASGKGTRTAAADVGRYVESISTIPQLSPAEAARLQQAFLAEYQAAYRVSATQLAPAIKLYRVDLDLAAIRFARNPAETRAALRRLEDLLHISLVN